MSNAQTFVLKNPHLNTNDYLYHLNLSASDNLLARFGDVKFIVMGGKAARMRMFAEHMYQVLNKPKNCEFQPGSTILNDISGSGGRYSMFKVGSVLAVNHGIGMASLSVVLNEVFKLLHYAKCSDVVFLRLGTSGGVGVAPGTLVATHLGYTPLLENNFSSVRCGKEYKYKCETDPDLRQQLINVAKKINITLVVGNTIACNDFFEEQGRVDGAFCDYTEEDKLNYLKRAHDEFGIRNIEMESTLFSGMCGRAGARCGVICVTLLNRLNGDQVTSSKETMQKWEQQLFEITGHLISTATL